MSSNLLKSNSLKSGARKRESVREERLHDSEPLETQLSLFFLIKSAANEKILMADLFKLTEHAEGIALPTAPFKIP